MLHISLEELLKKPNILEKEALIDIKYGCFNKAATALYFALKHIATILLELRNVQYPRRDDKFANTIKAQGLPLVADALRSLYDLRKIADYSNNSIRKREIDSILPVYYKAKKILISTLKQEAKNIYS